MIRAIVAAAVTFCLFGTLTAFLIYGELHHYLVAPDDGPGNE